MSSTRNIVVIARDTENADQIATILIVAGYTVESTVSAPTGLRWALEQTPCAVICDGDLPSLGGGWISRLLKGNPSTAAIPLILITDTDVIAASADASLSREFQAHELLQTLEQCLVNAVQAAGTASLATAC